MNEIRLYRCRCCCSAPPTWFLSAGWSALSRCAVVQPDDRVIAISGSRSGAGKTRLAEQLLPAMEYSIGIKATREDGPLTVSEEGPGNASDGKDTGRFVAAGARKAFYLAGRLDELQEKVRRIAQDNPADTIIVEANSLAERLAVDRWFFVRAPGPSKPGSADRMSWCDAVVLNPVLSSVIRVDSPVMPQDVVNHEHLGLDPRGKCEW